MFYELFHSRFGASVAAAAVALLILRDMILIEFEFDTEHQIRESGKQKKIVDVFQYHE